MNKFYKISEKQFNENFGVDQSRTSYEDIVLPKRGTAFSAGYDFFAPYDFELEIGQTITIPTGIKVELDTDKFLAVVPRSSLGFKFRCQLDNTIGVIDSDYFNNTSNEGHIFVRITNDGKQGKKLVIHKGEAFCQGIILQYFTTEDDCANGVRRGGIGSTSKRD